jgi:hypothetical protein
LDSGWIFGDIFDVFPIIRAASWDILGFLLLGLCLFSVTCWVRSRMPVMARALRPVVIDIVAANCGTLTISQWDFGMERGGFVWGIL